MMLSALTIIGHRAGLGLRLAAVWIGVAAACTTLAAACVIGAASIILRISEQRAMDSGIRELGPMSC